MSKRSDRREADRQARKLAYLDLRNQKAAVPVETSQLLAACELQTSEPVEVRISPAQLIANRANAQLSSGPVTSAGKAASSRNALKTGLTGRTVLLPGDDAEEYNRRHESALAHYHPASQEEQALVQSLVDIEWRLDRVVTLETGIYLKGAAEFAHQFESETPAQRKLLIQTETYLKYEKSLRNLNVQEARLQRQRTRHLAELKHLQEERARRELTPQPAQHRQPARPVQQIENGFDFSTLEFLPPAGSPAASTSALTAEPQS